VELNRSKMAVWRMRSRKQKPRQQREVSISGDIADRRSAYKFSASTAAAAAAAADTAVD